MSKISSVYITSLKDKTTKSFLIKLLFWILILILWIKEMVLIDFTASFLTLIVLGAIIIYLISNFLTFFKYYMYLDKIIKYKAEFIKDKCLVKIFQPPLRTTTMLRSGTILLEIMPKQITCDYILLSDCFILFCKIPYLKFFQKYIDPIIVSLDHQNDCLFKANASNFHLLEDLIIKDNSLILDSKKNKEKLRIEILDFNDIIKSPIDIKYTSNT